MKAKVNKRRTTSKKNKGISITSGIRMRDVFIILLEVVGFVANVAF